MSGGESHEQAPVPTERCSGLPKAFRSRGLTLICVPLLASLALLAWTGYGRSENAPRGLVVLGSEIHDFGECHQGAVLTHTFELANKAGTPIKIVGLETSCSCMAAEDLGATTIASGDSFALPIHFTTGAAQETTSGRIIVHYRKLSKSADSAQPHHVSLRVRADVIPDYRISPREIDFEVIDGLAVQHVSRTFRVVPEAAPDVEIREVSSASGSLSAEILPRTPNVPGVEIKVRLDCSRFTRSRPFNGSVVLSTDSERLPKAIVRVRAKYDALAEAEPDMIVIGSDEEGEIQRDIRVITSRPA